MHGVDSDAVLPELEGRRFRHAADGPFARCITDHALDAFEPGVRGNIHDRAAPGLPHHADDRAHPEKDADLVHVHDGEIVGEAVVLEVARPHDARVVDQDVEAAEAGPCLGDGVGPVLFAGDVEVHISSRLTDLRRDLAT